MAGRKSDGIAADLREQLRVAIVRKVDTWNVAQSEAARRLGADGVALNRMLLGRRTPSLEALLSFADAADMTFRYIIEDSSSEPQQKMSPDFLSAPDEPLKDCGFHSKCDTGAVYGSMGCVEPSISAAQPMLRSGARGGPNTLRQQWARSANDGGRSAAIHIDASRLPAKRDLF